jgi:hypothetical protein
MDRCNLELAGCVVTAHSPTHPELKKKGSSPTYLHRTLSLSLCASLCCVGEADWQLALLNRLQADPKICGKSKKKMPPQEQMETPLKQNRKSKNISF